MKRTKWFAGLSLCALALAAVVQPGSGMDPKKLFGGDPCGALTANDFAQIRGFKIVATSKPIPSQCLYQLRGTTSAALSVFLDDAATYDLNRGIYSPVTSVPGLGDEAYSGKAGGSHMIAVKAKGIHFRIDDSTGRFTWDEMKELAKAVIAKL